MNQGLTDLEVWAVAVDPENPEDVYAGTRPGVFKSKDGAANWRRLPVPIPKSAIVAVR